MLRSILHWLLVVALATAGSALPRHAHAAPGEREGAMQDHHAGHATHAASEAPETDCCADQGCDCGCAVAPALGPTPMPPTRFTLVEAPAAPATGVPPAARHRPPLRPPAA